MSIEHVQNLVIGSGVGGKLVAWTLAKKGQTTAVVERAMIGGSCPNVACLPSKNVIYSAKAGSPKFTHVSEDDFRIVLDNLSGGSRTTRDRLIPYCLFTDPELAHVGINETEAKAKNISYRVAKMPMANVFRALTMSATRGFVKALIGDDDRILGFTAFGAEASEMMAVVQTAMLGRLPYTTLRDAIWTHPTTAEGLIGLFSNPPSPERSSL